LTFFRLLLLPPIAPNSSTDLPRGLFRVSGGASTRTCELEAGVFCRLSTSTWMSPGPASASFPLVLAPFEVRPITVPHHPLREPASSVVVRVSGGALGSPAASSAASVGGAPLPPWDSHPNISH